MDSLIHKIMRSDVFEDFPLEALTEYFGATSGSFWLREIKDYQELTLVSSLNRSPLRGKEFNVRKSPKVSGLFRFLSHFGPSVGFIYSRIDDPRIQGWKDTHPDPVLIDESEYVLFLPFRGRNNRWVAAVTMFSKTEPMKIPKPDVLRAFLETVGLHFSAVLHHREELIIERRKIGHEIGRLLGTVRSEISNFEEAILRRRSMKNYAAVELLEELRSALDTAKSAADNNTFSEGVLARKNCNSIPLKHNFDTVAEPYFSTLFDAADGDLAKWNLGLQADSNITVKIHQFDLELLVSNLIQNATKYATDFKKISSRILVDDDTLRIRVQNPTELLTEDDLEALFHFAYQGSNASEGSGKGIGLSVVHDICVAYELTPRIELISKELDEAIFRIEIGIPRKRFYDPRR